MRARFHPEASLDFKNAAARYAAVRLELGQGFYRHVEELIAEIEVDPTLFRVYRPPHARRHFRRPFPYAVVYVVKPDHVWVLAVMHFKQPPSYWLHRLER
ncbi:MAG: type II toxin-antitoxin system RelE/ParE family toxin [Opitutaceae bacterium]|nr:type II toxin-antitoxin system RelE/ParE family toxin [Opitutaceae bacterium]